MPSAALRFATAGIKTAARTKPCNAAEDRIQAITKQLDFPHGLTNKERRALANERQRWERMFNLGIYSPVPVGEIDERKDRATEKKLRWLAKKKAAQVSPGPAVAPQTCRSDSPGEENVAEVFGGSTYAIIRRNTTNTTCSSLLIRYESRAPQDGRSVVRRRCKTVKKRDAKEAVLDMRHNSV